MADGEYKLPTVPVPEPAPTRAIKPAQLKALGEKLSQNFDGYKSDRRDAELQWVKNLRQYLGKYDPEIDGLLDSKRSKAYPRMTRVKLISVISRIMNLMFPGNERNWEVKASPSPEMTPDEVKEAVQQAMTKRQELGLNDPPSPQVIREALQRLADERAEGVSNLIDDQLQELGGDQTLDWIALNRKVLMSGGMYGTGVLRGPFVRKVSRKAWAQDPMGGYQPMVEDAFKPQYEFLPIWDFYPDMAAKNFYDMDGYFMRLVMTKTQLRKLADREDFFGEQIKHYISNEGRTGNYKEQPFESDLRGIGQAANVNPQKADTRKYEIIVWHGAVDATTLAECGVEIPKEMMSDDVEAEIWMVGNCVIKADVNGWRKLGIEMRQVHVFTFDEDDTSIFGNGLPAVVRDSQMSICAATRMLLDNASVVCGPNLEMDLDQLLTDQDLKSISPYKIWYKRSMDPMAAQYPAIRNIQIDSHIDELMKVIGLFQQFMDAESFVGPATGGDMDRGPSEPFRTAAGASMLRGEAALPFKDVIRNFDTFIQSVIYSLVQFNRKFNPEKALPGDYDVIARGATSLIAKEIKGAQLDAMAQTLTPEDYGELDRRAFLKARLAARDIDGLLLPPDEARRMREAGQQMQQQQTQLMIEKLQAENREILAGAFKDIAQGQKNLATADKTYIDATNVILEQAIGEDDEQGKTGGAGKAS